MDGDTGDIFRFDTYQHIRTGTVKPRYAVVLVPKEITDLVLSSNCKQCSDNCGIYSSPLEKPSRYTDKFSVAFKKVEYSSWLDTDRFCKIIDSNLQETCTQQCQNFGKINKVEAGLFLEQLKLAYRANIFSGTELYDPNLRAVVFQQWEDLVQGYK